jgi:ABC-type transport system involved in multi-copper enzyme maturation permease subunit
MNATTLDIATAQLAGRRQPRLLGIRNLLGKDVEEWLRSKRPWTVVLVSLLVFLLAAANARINEWVLINFPAEAGDTVAKVISFQPMDNLLAAVGSQFIVIAVIFATMSLLLAERDSGTLAWTISKPVSRTSVLVSKWLTSTAILWIAAVVTPIALTTAVVTVLYGLPDFAVVATLSVALIAVPALYVAITLTLGTIVPSQAAVGAIALALFVTPQIVSGIVPGITPFLPTSIFSWAIDVSLGGSSSLVTPVVWLVGMIGLFIVARNRLNAMEL